MAVWVPSCVCGGCDVEGLDLGAVRVPYSFVSVRCISKTTNTPQIDKPHPDFEHTRPLFGGLAYRAHKPDGAHHADVALSAPFL